jgi:hypothetical protein
VLAVLVAGKWYGGEIAEMCDRVVKFGVIGWD